MFANQPKQSIHNTLYVMFGSIPLNVVYPWANSQVCCWVNCCLHEGSSLRHATFTWLRQVVVSNIIATAAARYYIHKSCLTNFTSAWSNTYTEHFLVSHREYVLRQVHENWPYIELTFIFTQHPVTKLYKLN